jgi:hypothetical protein
VPVLVLGVVTLVVGVPLLFGRVLAGQDIVNYLVHAQQTAENLRQGALFPSFGGGYYSGYGSPVLLFFPPLPCYAGALVVLGGLPVAIGVGWLALAAHFLSGVAVYGWLRSVGAGRAALPAGVVYMIAPYRWVDLYLRSALAEHWAFVWPPLILWIAGSRSLPAHLRLVFTAGAVTGLLLSNVPLAVLFGIGLAAWFVMSVELRGRRLHVAAGVVLALGLSAFFLVPLAMSSSLLDLSACFGPEVPAFLPSSNTLFASGHVDGGLNRYFSWMVLSTFGLVLTAWLLVSGAERAATTVRWPMLASLICLASTTTIAGPLWDATPILSNLQFPWRVTAVLVLLGAYLVGRLETRRAWAVVVIAAGLSVVFSGWDRTMERSAFQSEEPGHRHHPGTVFPDPVTAWEAGSGGWYWRHHHLVELCLLPKAMPRSLFGEFAGSPGPSYDRIRHRPAVVMEDPSLPVLVGSWKSASRSVAVDLPVPGTLLWRVISFPVMEVNVDGRKVAVSTEPTTGLISHPLPAGEHVVHWSWHPFPELRWARRASVASFAVVLAVFVVGWSRVRKNRRETVNPAHQGESRGSA